MKKRYLTSLDEGNKEPLYIQLYNYYKKLILEGTLTAGDRLPSIRKCAEEWQLSRTTVESAYLQLVSEGYVNAREGSGFFVCELDYDVVYQTEEVLYQEDNTENKVKYDFETTNVDSESFNFELWRRYIKSSLRNVERLVTYGDPQGEYDLRVELANYIREKRGVMCEPNQIVVGAGMQTLLHIICSLLEVKKQVMFIGNNYKQGQFVLEERGFEVSHCNSVGRVEGEYQLVYSSPSHYSPTGGVMLLKERLELLMYAKKMKAFIIEDDYDSDFNYTSRPIPSLQGLDGGQSVIYMSTFSKILLPSLRMSFMVLPKELAKKYQAIKQYYSQTTSKTEQIALCQFIRDGYLEKQVKKAKKLYINKKQQLIRGIEKVCGEEANIQSGESGFFVKVTIKNNKDISEVKKQLKRQKVSVKAINQEEDGISVLLSCSGIKGEKVEKAVDVLRRSISE